MVWELITLLGDEKIYIFLIFGIYFLIDKELGWRVLLLLVLSALSVYLLKDIFHLPRPPQKLWKVPAKGYAFPSGHATASTTFWTYISLKFRSIPLYILSVTLISLIASSRVLLGIHYPRDVIGGILIGFIITIGFLKVEKLVGNLKGKTKNKILLSSALIVIFTGILLSQKIRVEGLLFLGFAFAHLLIQYIGIESEVKKTWKRIINFSCASILSLGAFVCFTYFTYAPLIFGFLACWIPTSFWYFVDKYTKLER